MTNDPLSLRETRNDESSITNNEENYTNLDNLTNDLYPRNDVVSFQKLMKIRIKLLKSKN